MTSGRVLREIFGFASDTVPKSIQLLLRGPTHLEILYALCGEIKNQACQSVFACKLKRFSRKLKSTCAEICRNHEILCMISEVSDPLAITECFRVREKQL